MDNLSKNKHDLHTAISRKVVGKSARDNPEWYCGLFLIHCFSKKFQTMAREAMDVCLRVLKESNKSRFDSYSVRKSVLIISHITFRDCRVHSFSDNLSRNSCIRRVDQECQFMAFFSAFIYTNLKRLVKRKHTLVILRIHNNILSY